MNCFIFPGQPLATAGETPDDPDFLEIAALVRERTRFDLERHRWLDGENTPSVALQVYGVAMSLHAMRLLAREAIFPDMIGEHSMGIYPALVACGALTEGDALELAFRVGRQVATMAKTAEYSLCAVVGLTREPLERIAADHGVYVANFNTSRHFLLSGPRHGIARAGNEALARGAFSAATFPCDAPLHTPLMAELRAGLEEIVGDYRYRQPAVPLLEHIDQTFLGADVVAGFLVRELSLPVYWERSYRALRLAGVTTFREVGAGDALKKYNRWIDSEERDSELGTRD